MEFAAGGDMFQYVKARGGLDEADARWFFQQLIIGLDYCHRMGVVNRDIKLENTLLDGGARPLLKICDFGYSKNEKDSLPKSKVGTPVRREFFWFFSRVFLLINQKPFPKKTHLFSPHPSLSFSPLPSFLLKQNRATPPRR